MASVEIGKQYRFMYPEEFVTLPEYTAIRGSTVTVIRPMTEEEADNEGEQMYKVRTEDGREWDAWESELEDL